MALGTGNISLQDVTTEIFGDTAAGRDLYECFVAANANGFNATYEGDRDELDDFKGYNHSVVSNTIFQVSANNASHVAACADPYYGATYWHDGAAYAPAINDNVWVDEDHLIDVVDGYYKAQTFTYTYRIVNGIVTERVSC